MQVSKGHLNNQTFQKAGILRNISRLTDISRQKAAPSANLTSRHLMLNLFQHLLYHKDPEVRSRRQTLMLSAQYKSKKLMD